RRSAAAGGSAHPSASLAALYDQGLFPPYPEKPGAGLDILDRSDSLLYRARYPRSVYAEFESIPPVVVNTLLFLENRELLDARSPYSNPAVEWDRLGAATANFAVKRLAGSEHVYGASTLATQLEKFRHSPDGVTRTARDKIRQMTSASLRSYSRGPTTLASRHQIVMEYLNAVPLGAAAGYGEVIGIGEGLWAWYGLDFVTSGKRLVAAGVSTAPVPA